MKKNLVFILLLFCVLTTSQQALAKSFIAESVNDFDSTNPSDEFSVKILEDTVLGEKAKLEKDSIIKGSVIKIIPPKRLKQDAYFVFLAKTYTIPSENDTIVEIKTINKTKVKTYTPVNKANVAEQVAIAAAGTVVKGLGIGVNFVKGIAAAEEGENKFKSGMKNAYDNSPLSYCEKGSNFCVKSGSLVIIDIDGDILENQITNSSTCF